MLNYSDKNYAVGRLIGTIVRYNSKPVMVNEINGTEISYRNLLTSKTEYGLYDGLDINPVPLGYTNSHGISYYLTRCPMRKDWKQGLRSQTMRALECGANFPISHEINLRDVARTIIGEFPSVEKAIKALVDNDAVTIAFSRTFALDGDGSIWHKAIRNIGKLNFKNGDTDIKEEFFWVKEELKEAMA